MNVNNLQLGDIIFFVGEMEDGYEYVDHVAMYTGIEHGQPRITHAVDHPSYKALCSTTLKPQPYTDDDGNVIGTIRYKVFRSPNRELARDAAMQILKWANYQPKFDDGKLEALLTAENEDHFDSKAYMQHSQEQYREEGFLRSLQYAARRDMMLMHPSNNLGGLVCVTAVIAAYQAVELAPFVRAANLDEWPVFSGDSDIDFTEVPMTDFLLGDDINYETVDSSIPLDAEDINPGGFLEYLSSSERWIDMGAVKDLCDFTPSEDARRSYRDRRRANSASAAQQRNSLVRCLSRGSSLSSSLSPSPMGSPFSDAGSARFFVSVDSEDSSVISADSDTQVIAPFSISMES